MSEIIQRILENPDCRQLTCTVAVVTKSLENINHSTLSYHLTRDFPGSSIEIEPVARFGDRYFLNWLTSDYVVYVPQIRDNFYSNAIVSLFEQRSPDALKHAYEQVASFSLPNEWTARLLRRTKPLAIDEATSAVEALDVPQDLKNQLLDQVQSLYE